MEIKKAKLNPFIIQQLIAFSIAWREEGCCFGMEDNVAEDIKEPCYLAYDGENLVGYAFGEYYTAKKRSGDIQPGDTCFDLLELYVIPSYRDKGVGRMLFEAISGEVKGKASYLTVACPNKDYHSALNFYVEREGMTFQSAFLFKPSSTYGFYGANTPSVMPKDSHEIYGNQRHLYDLLSACWGKDTCAPRMAKDWTKENKTLGQCSITAFLVQDIYGGEVYGVPLSDGAFHCFNKVGDVLFDLTSEQFGNETLDYTLNYPQSREVHFASSEKKARYELLWKKLIQAAWER